MMELTEKQIKEFIERRQDAIDKVLLEAAQKAARTGEKKDLRNYLKLRKQRL